MKYCITFILLAYVHSVMANGIDSLTLTDAEMKKLKQFFPVEETEHLVWNGDPIKISLPIEKEKRIVFSSNVSVDIRGALTTDQLRLLNNNKSLYFTALKKFATTRMFVTLKETGEVILIDLTANDQGSSSTQYIDIKKNNIRQINQASTNEDNSHEKISTYIDLIRFAWQQSYAPERLQESNPCARTPMHTQKYIADLVYGDKVFAFPLSSWISGKYYITVVELRNKYAHLTHIDVRKDLCGDWLAATLYPRSILKPAGHKTNDSTTLFLISVQPFGATIGVCNGHA